MRKIKKSSIIFASVTIITILLASCASIIQGGSQKIPIQSNPSEASVKVIDNNSQTIGTGTTPCTINLKRGNGFFTAAKYRIMIEKTGFTNREIEITGRISGWYIGGNLIFGGLIGWLIVDPATGAMWTLDPSKIRTDLASKQGFLFLKKEGYTIMLMKDVPLDYQKYLKPVDIASTK